MTFTREIAFIDLETTGLDPVKDRIVEFGVVVLAPDFTLSAEWWQRFNPGIPIPAEATKIHGISDEDVKHCPPFAWWAERIWKGLQGRDLAGYNLSRFDLAVLDEELRRAGGRLCMDGVLVFDACRIFKAKEPRTLEAAVKKYCGREHEGGHGAGTDAAAAADVFQRQISAYPDLWAMTPHELAAFGRDKDREYADLAGKLYRDDEGDLCFAFGKHEGRKVLDEPDYADWMLGKNFPGATKDLLRDELSGLFRGTNR